MHAQYSYSYMSPQQQPQQQNSALAALPASTPLHDAAEAGDAATVSMLLAEGHADADARAERPNYDKGATALHMAAQRGHLEVALALLRAGATASGAELSKTAENEHEPHFFHRGDWDGDLTPLHEAAARGHISVVRALLSSGERTDRIGSGRKLGFARATQQQTLFGERGGGQTPLHLASALGHADVVRALVDSGACVQGGLGACEESPLHYAAKAGEVETMATLVDAGADVDACDEIGNTPLHAVADARSLEFLLASGANPNKAAESPYGTGTPLGTYCTLIHRLETNEGEMLKATALVETLLRGGADPSIHAGCNSPGEASPILSCAAKNGVPGIVNALLVSGVDPDERDRGGWAPLHDAAMGDHVGVLRVLLRAGADRDAPTHRGGWTPLHIACLYTSVECVLELLRWGVDLNARSSVDLNGNDSGSDLILGTRRIGASKRCGVTPAEVVGLKNCVATAATTAAAAAAAAAAAPALEGGSADPSEDEDGQMGVFDEGSSGGEDTSAAAAARNAIRDALRREASWRRRRGLLFLKAHLDRDALETPAFAAGTIAPVTPCRSFLVSCNKEGVRGSITGYVRVREKGFHGRGDAGVKVARLGAEEDGVVGGGGASPHNLLERVIDLAGCEEALFRQIVMCL